MIKIGILIDGENAKYWGIDYVRLVQYLFKEYEIYQPEICVKRIYVSANINDVSDEQKSFWHFMKMNGYDIIKRFRHEGQSVDVDAQIGSDLRKYSKHCDVLVLIAGDGDYLPVLEDLVDEHGQKILIITRFKDTSTEIKRYKDKTYSNIQVRYLVDMGIRKVGAEDD